MSLVYTLAGYATLIGVGLIIYQVSTQKSRKRNAGTQVKPSKASTAPEPRKEEKKKKQRLDNRESTKAKTPAQPTSNADYLPLQDNAKARDGADDKEFAKQFAKAKEGTKFAAKSDNGKQREKSVKQSRANKINNNADQAAAPIPAPSSTSGAEADDDGSSAASPAAEPADSTGVADMLEPAPSGPSILRLTDTTPKTQPKKPAKAPEKVETKKQRQHKKKAEAAKAAREDAEKERKILEEKQRRVARQAEGRVARDGSQFTNAAVKNAAWNQGPPNGSAAPKADTNGASHLLDTFEPEAAQPSKPVQAKQAKPAVSESTWMASLPSEEEQIERLKDETDEWSTVTTKSAKKASKKEPAAESNDEAPAQSRPAAPVQPSVAPSNTSKPTQSRPTQQSFGGSFSALTPQDEAADNVVEEWEVS